MILMYCYVGMPREVAHDLIVVRFYPKTNEGACQSSQMVNHHFSRAPWAQEQEWLLVGEARVEILILKMPPLNPLLLSL